MADDIYSGYRANIEQGDRSAQSRIVMQQLMQALQEKKVQDAALALRGQGYVQAGALGAPQQQPGMPPPPGTPQGGPQPPGVGVSSPQPQQGAPPPPMQPGGGVPPPPGVQFNNPNPQGANLDFKGINPAQIQALMQKIQNPAIKQEALGTLNQAQQIPPFKSMPTGQQAAPPAGGGVPPPPQQETAPLQQPGSMETDPLAKIMKSAVDNILKSGQPPEVIASAIESMHPMMQNELKNQMMLQKQYTDTLLKYMGLGQKDRALDQKDVSLGQGQEKNDLQRQKIEEARANFGGANGDLMAAIAERGISLPAGFRSKEQQVALLNGLRSRNPELSTEEIADKIASGQLDINSQKAAGRTAGGIAGKVAYAENEIEQTIPLVREASKNLPRGQFVPWNKLSQMAEASISDPNLKELKVYMTSLSNAYDVLSARGGTDKDKRAHNRELFDTADSPEALERVMSAVQKEARAAGAAADKSMKPRSPGADSTVDGTVMPKEGEKRIINGTPAHWDGKGWLAD